MGPAMLRSIPRQPPHSLEAEQSVLGGLLLNNALWPEVSDHLQPEDFYRTDHQLLYRVAGELLNARQPCDFVTLTERLRSLGRLEEAGGAGYLGSLASETYSVANVVAYAEIVRERSVLRSLAAAGADIGDLAYRTGGRTAAELIDEAEKRVLAIGARRSGGEAATSAELVQRVNARIERLRAARARDRTELAGLATGFTALDFKTNGMEPGDLIVLAARPAMGKTALAVNVCEHLSVHHGVPTALFSMEMSGEQLMLRLLSSYARLPLAKLRNGDLTETEFDRMTTAQVRVNEAPFYIDETPALSPMELRSRARRLVAKYGVRLIVVDYLQLMQVPNTRDNRANEVSIVSRSLKALAKEQGVPVLALSQLSRELENRPNKRPRLADLRESGSIEQDADMVWFIHREEVFNNADEHKGRAEIIVGKQRQGPTGKIDASYCGEFCRFDNAVGP